MTVAAVLLFLTVSVGVVVLGFWEHPERRRADPRSFVLGIGHVIVAVSAVIVWVVYLVGRSSGVRAASTVGLLAAVGLGVSTLLSSRRGNSSTRYESVPESVPMGLLVVHGAVATVAIAVAIVVGRP